LKQHVLSTSVDAEAEGGADKFFSLVLDISSFPASVSSDMALGA
jgi:hypothetical protein